MVLLLIVACTFLDGAGGDGRLDECCRAENISVLLKIPDDRRIAVAYSRRGGHSGCLARPPKRFTHLLRPCGGKTAAAKPVRNPCLQMKGDRR
jgi:hypothetical protein